MAPWHAEEVMQDDDRTPAGLEGPERAIEQVAIHDATAEIGGRRDLERSQLHLDRTALAAPDQVEAGIDEQSMEPGVEPVHVAQCGEVAPAPDESLLDSVPCKVGIPEDQACGRVQARDGCAGQHREGVMIASLRSLDETSLVHGRLRVSARPRWPCSTS